MISKKKNYIIIFFIIITIISYDYINLNSILQPTVLNQNNNDLDLIIKLVEKFINPDNAPILTLNEQLSALYWNEKPLCPFSKLISHGLTKKEALLIIDFFQIEDIGDLEKLKIFINNIKK